jgi:hypothetical protein
VLQQQQSDEAAGVAGVEQLASPHGGRMEQGAPAFSPRGGGACGVGGEGGGSHGIVEARGTELRYNRSTRCNTCNDIDEPSTHADQPHETQDSKDRYTWASADKAHRIPHVSNASGLRARTRPGSCPSSRAQPTGYLATMVADGSKLANGHGHGRDPLLPQMGAQPAEEERERAREVSASAVAVTVETCHNMMLSEEASKLGVGSRFIGWKEGLIGSFGKGGGGNESSRLAANGRYAAAGAEKNAVLPATGGKSEDDDDWM